MRLALVPLAMSLLAVPLFAESPDTAGADKLGWKLALQSWTTHGSVVESIDYARLVGLHFIDIYPGQELAKGSDRKWGPEMTADEIKQMLDAAKAADVKIIDTGVIGISSREPGARKLFDWAKSLGITTIVSEPEPAALPMIDRLAGQYQINVAIHDHPKPSRYWDPEYTFGLIKDLKNVGFCADVGHWQRSGLEPVDVLRKYGQKVFSLHFKDLVKGDGPNGYVDVLWGTGDSKMAEMLAVLKEKGFKGPIAIEYEWKWDVPTLRKCADFFHEQANQLAK